MRTLKTILIVAAVITISACLHENIAQPAIEIQEVFPPVFNESGPVARANIKYRQVAVGETIQFDAGASINRQPAQSLSYHWELLNRPAGSQADISSADTQTSHLTIDVAGNYSLRLTASSQVGNTDFFDIILSTNPDALPRTSFIAMGDFGTGSVDQYRVSRSIESLCKEVACDFVIGLGDNFYNAGVESKTDVQITNKFEKPYENLALPFYMVLGNHDTSGIWGGDGGLNIRGDIQIAYSKWHNKPSFRWQMPARYYRISAPVEQPEQQPLVDLYALDTTLITSPYDAIPRYDLERMYQKESAWISYEKRNSKAQWQIAFGHHPYISNGAHGNAGNYDTAGREDLAEIVDRAAGVYVKQFVESQLCGHMDLLISGHDHNMQYLHPHPGCPGMEQIVSGAGAKKKEFREADSNPAYWQTDSMIGFFHIDIVADRMTITAYTLDESSDVAVERYRRTMQKN